MVKRIRETDKMNLLQWTSKEVRDDETGNNESKLRTNQINIGVDRTCFSFSLCCRTIAMYFSISGSNFGSIEMDFASPAAALPASIATVPVAGCSSTLETFSTDDC